MKKTEYFEIFGCKFTNICSIIEELSLISYQRSVDIVMQYLTAFITTGRKNLTISLEKGRNKL